MKRVFCFFLLFSLIFCSSCAMESVIPETGETNRYYFENEELFSEAVSELTSLGFDAFISKNDYYSVEGSEDFNGLYIQNMSDSSFSAFSIYSEAVGDGVGIVVVTVSEAATSVCSDSLTGITSE